MTILEQKFYHSIEVDQSEKDIVQLWAKSSDLHELIQIERQNINKLINLLDPSILKFITEIQQALTDKQKGGTKLSVQETGMLLNANEILNK